MEHNMNMFDVIIRYAMLMVIVIVGGIFHSLPLMLLGMPFFFSAILGWCPIFHMLGINHHTQNMQ
jgi:hypothetical protein